MTFSSVEFIFMFLPVSLLLYVMTPKKYKNVILLLVSFCFYAWGNIYHVVLLFLLILVNYVLGIYIENAKAENRRRHLLEAIIVNVAILFYFKYYGFVLENVFACIPHPPAYTLFDIPLGISFISFSIIGYLIDVYRKTILAEKNFLAFALFVSFFPKLVMGPIERYASMKTQFANHSITSELLEKGCLRFMAGLAQKLLLANTMGTIWSMCNEGSVSMLSAWLGILAYTFQIYFDFQGYTNMAIGIGNMFGFHLSKNFNYPYVSTSVTDFWRRWHMSLSSWFKDYVYISFGGTHTTFDNALRNLMLVWLLTGIWHGASWNFILWGLYYGVLLVVEKYIIYESLEKYPVFIRWLITFLIVMVGWVFFATDGLGHAFGYLGNMLMLRGNGFLDVRALQILTNYGIYFVVCAIACTPLFMKGLQKFCIEFKEQLWYLKPIGTACCFMILLAYVMSNTYQVFLYFKF